MEFDALSTVAEEEMEVKEAVTSSRELLGTAVVVLNEVEVVEFEASEAMAKRPLALDKDNEEEMEASKAEDTYATEATEAMEAL